MSKETTNAVVSKEEIIKDIDRMLGEYKYPDEVIKTLRGVQATLSGQPSKPEIKEDKQEQGELAYYKERCNAAECILDYQNGIPDPYTEDEKLMYEQWRELRIFTPRAESNPSAVNTELLEALKSCAALIFEVLEIKEWTDEEKVKTAITNASQFKADKQEAVEKGISDLSDSLIYTVTEGNDNGDAYQEIKIKVINLLSGKIK